MARRTGDIPDFFEPPAMDPIRTATGGKAARAPAAKKKAGFYLSVELLDRFDRKFYELKLAGAAVDNKSALLEAALSYALTDMERGEESRILQSL
jgi:hypothetical protein